MKYVKGIDGVRGIAILMVMLFHFYDILEVGWIGVQLFFVLSGYLITTILLEDKIDKSKVFFRRFFWRRSLRIFPLYFLYLGLVAMGYLIFQRPENFMDCIPYLLTYTYNYYPLLHGLEYDSVFPHFWSLSVEEQFYLFWPFLVFHLSKRGMQILAIFIIIFAPIFRFYVGWEISGDFSSMNEVGQIIYRLLPSQIDAFAFGALIPLFKLADREWNWNLICAISAVVFVGIGFINFSYFPADHSYSITSMGYPIGSMYNVGHSWSYTIIDLFCLTFILLVLTANPSHIFTRICSSKFMVSVGRISYGMYVYHWFIIFAFRKFIVFEGALQITLAFCFHFIVAYMVSWISYTFFERFFLKWKNKRYS